MKKQLIDDTGRVTDPTKALNCPFCGSKPIVTPFANNKGAFPECSSDTCALWGFKTDLNEWNARTLFTRKRLNTFLFGWGIDPTHDHAFYKCLDCGATAPIPDEIHHERGCEVAKLLKAMS